MENGNRLTIDIVQGVPKENLRFEMRLTFFISQMIQDNYNSI